MSGLETAIRNALDRSDRGNPETRARIYKSARLALESGLRKQDVTDPEIVAQQRQRLETIIQSIETEEQFALGSTPGKRVPPVVAPPERREPERREPDRGSDPAFTPEVNERRKAPEPVAVYPAGAAPRVEARAQAPSKPRFWGRSGEDTPASSRPDPALAAEHVPQTPRDVGAVDTVAAAPQAPADLTTRDPVGSDPLDGLPVAPVRPLVSPEPVVSVTSGENKEAVRAEEAAFPAVEPVTMDASLRDVPPMPEAARGDTVKPSKGRRQPKAQQASGKKRSSIGRFLFSTFLVVATLGAGIGAAAWWLDQQGLLQPLLDPDAEMPVRVADTSDGAGAGLKTLGKREGFTADWLPVFQPQEAGKDYIAGARAATEVVRDEAGSRLKIASTQAGPDGEVAIDVPANVLGEISGKTSTLALTVQGADGRPTEFYVECDFASLGSCGRHRFTVHGEKVDVLFQVRFDRTLAPGTPGKLLINSDVSGRGESLNLYAVRLLPGT
ncbi:hypothetical protein SAMN05880582_102333 [Rhizobium sp. RU20A]|nr:hypothetical protein [Rhizobium sp. RU20A]SIQ62244.1 hypothetical protein SAMN05880582_102333 [Rhizobium sp. RU20A]